MMKTMKASFPVGILRQGKTLKADREWTECSVDIHPWSAHEPEHEVAIECEGVTLFINVDNLAVLVAAKRESYKIEHPWMFDPSPAPVVVDGELKIKNGRDLQKISEDLQQILSAFPLVSRAL